MRMLLRAMFPVDAANAAINEGRMQRALQALIERMKPEACYFFPQEGQRGGIFVFDLNDPSDMPSIAEPLFQELHANIEVSPVMNLDDLRAGLEKVGRNL